MRGERPDIERTETAHRAADAPQHVLRGAARVRWIKLGHQRAVTAHHPVHEHAHENAADQQRIRGAERRVGEYHDECADLITDEGRLASYPVRKLAEDPDAGEHAEDR